MGESPKGRPSTTKSTWEVKLLGAGVGRVTDDPKVTVWSRMEGLGVLVRVIDVIYNIL